MPYGVEILPPPEIVIPGCTVTEAEVVEAVPLPAALTARIATV